jgi:hypothetical protein
MVLHLPEKCDFRATACAGMREEMSLMTVLLRIVHCNKMKFFSKYFAEVCPQFHRLARRGRPLKLGMSTKLPVVSRFNEVLMVSPPPPPGTHAPVGIMLADAPGKLPSGSELHLAP